MNEKLALDSQRSKDESGHLKVARTVLSKAAVNPYFGREIPDYLELGLDPDKVYKLLRDPSALEAGADTFKGKPLFIKHEYTDAKGFKQTRDLVIGAVGSNVYYEDGTLYGDITVWDEEAIELIESGKMEELSSSYWYAPEMVPGEFQGEAYDGTMLDIHGNHVALVARGRIGRDAIISDKLPFELEFHMLKKGTKQRVAAKLQTLAQGGIANDSDVEEVIREVAENIEHKPSFDEAKLRELAGDNYDAIVEMLGGKAAEDEVPEAPEGGADKPAEDEKDEEAEEVKDEPKKETAMDVDAIAASVQARIEGKYAARDKVEPLVGRIALDGFKDASAIYAYALKQKGIACDGVNEAGLAQLVTMAASQSKRPQVALDSAMHEPSALTSRFRKA